MISLRGSRHFHIDLLRNAALTKAAKARRSLEDWFAAPTRSAAEFSMSFFAFNLHPSPNHGIARFLVGALCAAALGAISAVFMMSPEGRRVWTSARFAPGCINSGKGGSLCVSPLAEKTSDDADCADLGRAGRRCFPAAASEARPRAGDRPNASGM
jgi:hypothetical protein